ncbi:MAG: hypothetical protein ACXWKP_06735 [Bradyrhizobium sp.]
MTLFQVGPARAYVPILFSWSQPVVSTLDPDPREFRVLRGPGRQWRHGGVAVLPRRFTALPLWCVSKLTSEEARRIGKAISRIPEFLIPLQGFYPRGGGGRWRPDRPYHVALEDMYIREHWDEIYRLYQVNSQPFNSTGETIQNDGVWKVYEFTWQMDAILFWDRFKGRWLRGTEFHYPERRVKLPSLKPLQNWPKFNPRNTR